MFPSLLPCTDINGCTSLSGLSHHPMMKNDKYQEWKRKNACHATILDGSTSNQVKGMYKTRWTLTQITYGIWWYEWGRGKLRWKAWTISNDVIHVQAKGGKYNNVKGINTLEIDDCMCVVHDVLNLFLLHINNHNQDKGYTDTINGWMGPWCKYKWLRIDPWLMR